MESAPPVISAAIFKNGRPSPTLRVLRVVQNGSVTRAAISGGIPLPLSVMVSVMRFAAVSMESVMATSVAPAATEFSATSRTFIESSCISAPAFRVRCGAVNGVLTSS